MEANSTIFMVPALPIDPINVLMFLMNAITYTSFK